MGEAQEAPAGTPSFTQSAVLFPFGLFPQSYFQAMRRSGFEEPGHGSPVR